MEAKKNEFLPYVGDFYRVHLSISFGYCFQLDQVPDLPEKKDSDEEQKKTTEQASVALVADPKETGTCQFSKCLKFNITFY